MKITIVPIIASFALLTSGCSTQPVFSPVPAVTAQQQINSIVAEQALYPETLSQTFSPVPVVTPQEQRNQVVAQTALDSYFASNNTPAPKVEVVKVYGPSQKSVSWLGYITRLVGVAALLAGLTACTISLALYFHRKPGVVHAPEILTTLPPINFPAHAIPQPVTPLSPPEVSYSITHPVPAPE